MDTFSHVPPGFRFHPTDEELVDYYLRKKVTSRAIDLDVIKVIDLYKIEPWDLEGLCGLGTEDQNEWYFFSHKDKKYPTGTRTNRATAVGFWKATGRDKAIYVKHVLVGMRKTLVYYKGRAPNGQKSDWIMHEYRLESDENGSPQEEGWAVCRVFKKKMTTVRRMNEHESCWFEDQVSFMANLDSPQQNISSYNHNVLSSHHPCKKETDHHHHHPYHQHLQQHHHRPSMHFNDPVPDEDFRRLPLLSSAPYEDYNDMQRNGRHDQNLYNQLVQGTVSSNNNTDDQQAASTFDHREMVITDWRNNFDTFVVASQVLSHEDSSSHAGNCSYSGNGRRRLFHSTISDDDDNNNHHNLTASDLDEEGQQQQLDCTTSASALMSTCPVDLWK